MKTYTADNLKTDIQAVLIQCVKTGRIFDAAKRELESLNALDDLSRMTWGWGAAERACSKYIEGIAREVTESRGDGTGVGARISWKFINAEEERNPGFRPLDLGSAEVLNSDDDKAVVDNFLSCVDFEATAAAINRECACLADRGRVEVAKKAQRLMGVYGPHSNITRKGARHVGVRTERYYGGQSDALRIEGDQVTLEQVAKEAGFEFGDALRQAAEARRAMSCLQEFASGTTFGKGLPVEITFYKYGWMLKVRDDAVDAIGAYIMLFGDQETQRDWVAALNEKAAA